jgi:hypothetical protein
MKRRSESRLRFDADDILTLLDALEFEFNYFTNSDHRDLNKAANAYSMAQRIAMHKPGRLGPGTDLSGMELHAVVPICQRNLQEWRAKFLSVDGHV